LKESKAREIRVILNYRGVLTSVCYALALSGLAAALVGQGANPVKSPNAPRPTPDAIPRTIDYNRDIQPILSKHCWPCHGNDKEILKQTGNMRLDSFAGATQDRGGYQAIVPRHPEKSKLIERIYAEEAFRMPPKSPMVQPLNEAQKALIKKWIAEGAEYRGHWAFEVPKMPALPRLSDPKWSRNEIDRFVLQKLDRAGLKPEKEAGRATLIRRASLTLTGLPPTPQEILAFLADKRPDAYEKLLDRMLNSPRYGENQARFWLDAVRYADTHGLHIDNERAVFPYRDWVVRALNQDLPFDKFTVWQLAGDLLPNPTLDQMIATGYVRMNPTTAEGGVIEAEFLAKNTFDRVDTTSTIFLGLTMGCAKCHDHKYDPITIKDYYSMYAFFNSTTDPVLDGNLKLHQPVMKAPYPDQAKDLVVLESELRQSESKVTLEEAKSWLAQNSEEVPILGAWEKSSSFGGKTFDEAFDTDFGPEPGGAEADVKWVAFPLKEEELKNGVVAKDNGAAYLRTTIEAKKAKEITLRLGSDDGIKVWVNGSLIHNNKVLRPLGANQDSVKAQLKQGTNSILVKIVNGAGGEGIFFGLTDARARRLSAALAGIEKPEAKPEAKNEAIATYLELGPETDLAKSYRRSLTKYRKLDADIPYTYVAREMAKPRPTFLLKRGNYETPGDRVDRNIPKALGDWTPGRPKNRLGLAQWLTDRRNPLTARVFVNRVWQQHFGMGLVVSEEDFGSRGEWPSHPELLDYLAIEFVEGGWSIKKLHKLILSSATYRQHSGASAAKRRVDPENKLLSRGPRYRLDAEVIRDQALYLSGLLVEKGGGRGDKPYQPPGLWEIIAYPISDTARYTQDTGEALYRRSLYLFWKRTSPPPAMMIFDAPMRESCVVRRSRTNTPTQALVTLNETGFVEAARIMAERLIRSKTGNQARLDYAFRLSTGRSPSAKEANILAHLLTERLAFYKNNHSAAHRLLEIGEYRRDESLDVSEVAAWTLVCNAILNLDEVLTLH
jgi:hypothetical protein